MDNYNSIRNLQTEEHLRTVLRARAGLLITEGDYSDPLFDIEEVSELREIPIRIQWDIKDTLGDYILEKITEWTPTSFEISALLIHTYLTSYSSSLILNGFKEDDPVVIDFSQNLIEHFGKWSEEPKQFSFRYSITKDNQTDQIYVKYYLNNRNQVDMYVISQNKSEILELIQFEVPTNVQKFRSSLEWLRAIYSKIDASLSKFIKEKPAAIPLINHCSSCS